MDGWSSFGWLIPRSFDWTHLETQHILVGWSEVWELAADLSKLQRRRHHDRKWIWGIIHQHPLRWGRWTSTYYLGAGWCPDFDPSIPNSSNTLTFVLSQASQVFHSPRLQLYDAEKLEYNEYNFGLKLPVACILHIPMSAVGLVSVQTREICLWDVHLVLFIDSSL